jgi:hypothetical protein
MNSNMPVALSAIRKMPRSAIQSSVDPIAAAIQPPFVTIAALVQAVLDPVAASVQVRFDSIAFLIQVPLDAIASAIEMIPQLGLSLGPRLYR